MVAQAFTFEELSEIGNTLSATLRRNKKSLPAAAKLMETALEKVKRAIDDTHYQQKPCNAYALVPLYIRSNNKE